MPITQTTVLALYGEVRAMVLLAERAAEFLVEASANTQDEALRRSYSQQIQLLRGASHDAERHAIEVLMEDAPKLRINPLDGSIE